MPIPSFENLEVVHHILEQLEKPPTLIEFVTDRLGHDRRYAIDSSKVRNQLSWKPIHDVRTGLTETVNWYRDNAAWWQPLLSR